MKKQINYRKIASLFVFLALFILVIEECHARVGGGGGFGGGRSGGSGGSGGDGYLIYMLIRLAFEYPLIGVPVLIGAVILFFKSGQKGKSSYTGHIIRKGNSVREDTTLAENIRRICQRDTAFSPTVFENRVKNSFYKLQELWSEGRLDKIRPFVSDGTYERFSVLSQMYASNRLRNVVEGIDVLGCKVVNVESSSHFDTVHVKITASAVDYFVDSENGRKVSGSKHSETFTEYWSFLRRPGTKSLSGSGLLEGFCPNCGTQLNLSDKTKCGSCQAVVSSGDYDWVLSEITQAQSWIPPVKKAVSGLDHLCSKDPAFNEQFMEDRVSTIFWALHFGEFSGNSKMLERFADHDFIKSRNIGLQPDQTRSFYADVAVGSVELVEIIPAIDDEFDRARIKVVWSGHLEKEKLSKRRLPNYDKSAIYSHEYVLKRVKNVLTPASSSLISMHCPNCGAPATERTGSECEYCSTSFVDGRRDWVLETIGRFSGYPSIYRQERREAVSTIPVVAPLHLDAENVLSAVISVMLADDVIDDRERESLNKLAGRLSYPTASLNGLIAGVKSRGFQAQIPDTPQGAKLFMKELVRMALADGNICRKELKLIKLVSSKVGYIDADVDMLIKRVRSDLYNEARATLHNRVR